MSDFDDDEIDRALAGPLKDLDVFGTSAMVVTDIPHLCICPPSKRRIASWRRWRSHYRGVNLDCLDRDVERCVVTVDTRATISDERNAAVGAFKNRRKFGSPGDDPLMVLPDSMGYYSGYWHNAGLIRRYRAMTGCPSLLIWRLWDSARMNVIVVSRAEIERGIVVRTPYVVVSISDTENRRPRLKHPATFRGNLFVQFHDAEPVTGSSLPEGIVVIDQAHAKKIWTFVQRHRNHVGTIVVQCEQGMSRSPAVAAAICRWLGLDESRFFAEYQPNEFVYRMLSNMTGQEGE